MKKAIILFLIAAININAAVHIVTTEEDDGFGSLRSVVASAVSGDTIMFAADVNYIILTKGQITINKNLVIIGQSKEYKTTISGNYQHRIFNVRDSNGLFKVYNLILENGKTTSRSGCVELSNYSNFVATNSVFRNNEGFSGGAVYVSYSNFLAIDCVFEKNKTEGAGSAVYTFAGKIIVINCSFYQNECFNGVGTIFNNSGILVSKNNSFSNN